MDAHTVRCCPAASPSWPVGLDAVLGGGGLVQLPALLVVLPQAPVVALLGTNKLASIVGTASAAVHYSRTVTVDRRQAVEMAGAAFVGSGLGALLATRADSALLRPVVLVALVAVLAYTLRRPALGEVETLRLTRRCSGASPSAAAPSSACTTASSGRAPAASWCSCSSAPSGCRSCTPARPRRSSTRPPTPRRCCCSRGRSRAVGPRRDDGGEQPRGQPGGRPARGPPRQCLGAAGVPRRGRRAGAAPGSRRLRCPRGLLVLRDDDLQRAGRLVEGSRDLRGRRAGTATSGSSARRARARRAGPA